MAIVNITIGKRQFQLSCDDGQEAHLRNLASTVTERVNVMASSLGSGNDLLLYGATALMIQDALNDAQARLATAQAQLQHEQANVSTQSKKLATSVVESNEKLLVDTLHSITEYVDAMAERIAKIA